MIHPYIACARRLAQRGIDVARIRSIDCETAEGIVHRLWEPLAVKRAPPSAYGAKFSIPFCVAYALVHGAVGLEAFTEESARDPTLLAIAEKVDYTIYPKNPYPDEYTGHVRVTMDDARVVEERQPHLRGGHREPLTRAEVEEKFRANCVYGGWPRQ